MCRAIVEGGRRCPYHDDPRVKAAASARQAASRMEDRVARAEASGITDEKLGRRVEKLVAAHERANERQQAVTAGFGGAAAKEGQPQPLGPARPTRADEITADRVNSMDWDGVADLGSELGDDPEAWDKLETLVTEREAREAEEEEQKQDEEFHALLDGLARSRENLATNPAGRSRRKLTQREQTREEYESYVAAQYFKAEEDLGFLVNKKGQAKGIDAYSLFSGPISRARKYGSEELQAWFTQNGRQTLASFRHQMLGWESDRKAAQNSRVEGFDHVANV